MVLTAEDMIIGQLKRGEKKRGIGNRESREGRHEGNRTYRMKNE